ncbi:hypothetical protein R3P38DRAFT_3565744 [Favolaschia claudopus]|uniref:Uncharacterized protein n=1 Tax=Favolaschia claudopus TaxID=2862362 RepID=A0AAW0DXF4_9AGAR
MSTCSSPPLRYSPPPPPTPPPPKIYWNGSSQLAREFIENSVQAHEQNQRKQADGVGNSVPRLIDLVANRLAATADLDTIQTTLNAIAPAILQNNIHQWHALPYTIMRRTLLRLFYEGAQEGTEWEHSTSDETHNKIDEWILQNEKHLNNSTSDWQRGLVTLDDADHVFPDYVLTKFRRTIRRPDSLPGFTILSLATQTSIAIQPSTAAFAESFSLISQGLLKNLDWSNLFTAGGIVLASLTLQTLYDAPTWCRNSDIDIYVYGLSPTEANKKIRHIFDTFTANLPPGTRTFAVRNTKTVTFYAKYPLRRIQVILKLVKSPREVLLNFDLDICAMGWDGSKLWMLPRAARALETGANVFTMNLIYGHYLAERRETQPQRVFKYAGRGYGLRFLPSYIASLRNSAAPQDLERIAEDTEYQTRDWLVRTFGYPSESFCISIFPGYPLSGFAALMRPTILWGMGRARELLVNETYWSTSSYEDRPAHKSDPEFPWNKNFTITGYLTHIHECNAKETTAWILSDPERLERHGVHSLDGFEIADAVQRLSGAPTIELLLHPQYDLRLPVILPCNFVLYANELVAQAQALAGLHPCKILEPAVPDRELVGRSDEEQEGLFVWRITPEMMWQRLDRRVDEVFEVLQAFRRTNGHLGEEMLQAGRFRDELLKAETRRRQDSEFESFGRWVGRSPPALRELPRREEFGSDVSDSDSESD